MRNDDISNMFKKYSGERKGFLEGLTWLTHDEFNEVVDSLKRQNKIVEDKKGHLIWIYDPEKAAEILNHPEKYPPVA